MDSAIRRFALARKGNRSDGLRPPRKAPADASPPFHRAKSCSARAESARLRARPRSGPDKRFPASSNRGSAIGGNRPKLTFIGWNERGPASIDSIWPPVMWLRSAPIAVVGGGGSSAQPQPLGGGEPAGDEADRGALDIALAAGDLAGEAQARRGLQAQTGVEQARGIEIGVAVHAAETGELRPFQPWNHAEDAALLAIFELGLEADDVEERAERIVLPELDDGIGFDLRIMRVGEPDRLHRARGAGSRGRARP